MPYGYTPGTYGNNSGGPSLASRGLDLATGGLGGLVAKIGGGLIKSIFGRGAEKRKAKAAQKAAQYEVNRKQKGLNRKQYNLAALQKALKREGWYGPEYMKKYGTVGPEQLKDWTYDAVPLEAGQSALGALAQGGAEGAASYFGDEDAARRDAQNVVRG